MWISKKRYYALLDMASQGSKYADNVQKQLNDFKDRTEPKICIWATDDTLPIELRRGEYFPVSKVVMKILDHLELKMVKTEKRDADVLLEKK